uniref:Purple acid phosphatase Fn3-like domain-containing protein n=1 Tax=Rhizophora mucronata TaxID=61149 RepID=A0A2P2NFC9_RHIMU
MRGLGFTFLATFLLLATLQEASANGVQPLSKIAIHRTILAVNDKAYVKAFPAILGLKGQNSEWVTLEYTSPNPSNDDWIGVFSPANFSALTCTSAGSMAFPPFLCTAPIKYQYGGH